MKKIIVGGGQSGVYIAKLLLENNIDVLVVENREEVFEKLSKELPEKNIYFGSGINPEVMERCGIASADTLVAVTGADDVNLVASTIAKFEFGVPRVIARINNPKNAWLFNAGMGVDASINQADLIAHIILEKIDLTNVMTLLKVGRGDASIIQIHVNPNSKAVGKPVRELAIPKKAVLINIFRDNDEIIPRGDTVIRKDDDILALADEDAQIVLSSLFES